jgi:hypothetical protein
MDQEEMTYTEGGGTFTLKMNKAAVKYVAQAAGALCIASVTAAMGVTGIGAIVSNALGNLIYNYMLDTLCTSIKDVNKSWTAAWIPNGNFTWNK